MFFCCTTLVTLILFISLWPQFSFYYCLFYDKQPNNKSRFLGLYVQYYSIKELSKIFIKSVKLFFFGDANNVWACLYPT